MQVPHLIATGRGYLFRPLPLATLCAPAGVREYVRLMAPGFVMQVLEWWVQVRACIETCIAACVETGYHALPRMHCRMH